MYVIPMLAGNVLDYRKVRNIHMVCIFMATYEPQNVYMNIVA